MVGQQELKNKIQTLLEDFPRFIVLTGRKGQGKKSISRYIARKLKFPAVFIGTKVDEIRNMIEMSYKQTEPIIYIISDADKMSVGAKNSLLKVIEEPPNNAYFILTLQQIENTISTIKSRCIELKLNDYSEEEKNKIIDIIDYNVSDKEREFLLDICENYYEIQLVLNYGVTDFYNYVQKVVDNIYKVQSANAFKLAERLALKNEEDKYEVDIFLKTFKVFCIKKLLNYADVEDNDIFTKYAKSIDRTCNTLQELNITGINKQSLIDVWILNIREIWRN